MVPKQRRSREGAWIEIPELSKRRHHGRVAPARERGLKYTLYDEQPPKPYVAPARERGLKWDVISMHVQICFVAPVRERGLKYIYAYL